MTPSRNGHSGTPPPGAPAPGGEQAEGIDMLVEEALALHALLRDALARTNRLVQSLKQRRKQNRLMAAALTSLRQFQRVSP